MKEIYNIFTKSPFAQLSEHMDYVHQCVEQIQPLMDLFVNGEVDQMSAAVASIQTAENLADTVKSKIREHLPKSIFMPVSREDVLKLLHRQDNIADHCQDLSILISVRSTPVLDELKPDILSFTQKSLEATQKVKELSERTQALMETSFSGPQAEQVLALIEEIGDIETQTDRIKYDLVKKMFELESKIDPVSVVLFLKIFDAISHIADSAENVANTYRLMISK